jgi:hypothetical protein
MKSDLCGSLDHALGSENFRLPDRRGRLDIDNDRILNVDQVVRGVSKERLSAMGASPAGCQIGRRDELGNDLGRGSKCRIVQDGQILIDGTARGFWRSSVVSANPAQAGHLSRQSGYPLRAGANGMLSQPPTCFARLATKEARP